jgi:hypothetical protein
VTNFIDSWMKPYISDWWRPKVSRPIEERRTYPFFVNRKDRCRYYNARPARP